MEKKMIVFPSDRNGSWFSSWNNHQDMICFVKKW